MKSICTFVIGFCLWTVCITSTRAQEPGPFDRIGMLTDLTRLLESLELSKDNSVRFQRELAALANNLNGLAAKVRGQRLMVPLLVLQITETDVTVGTPRPEKSPIRIRLLLGRPTDESEEGLAREVNYRVLQEGREIVGWLRRGREMDDVQLAGAVLGSVVAREALIEDVTLLVHDSERGAYREFEPTSDAKENLVLRLMDDYVIVAITARWAEIAKPGDMGKEPSDSLADAFDPERETSDVRRTFRAALARELLDMDRWLESIENQLDKPRSPGIRELLHDAELSVRIEMNQGARRSEEHYIRRAAILERLLSDSALHPQSLSALESAAVAGNLELLEMAFGALDLRLFPNRGRDAFAARGQIVKKLHRSDGRIPLHFAALGGHAAIARFLAEDAFHPLAALDQSGRFATPLHIAALMGHASVVRTLLPEIVVREARERAKLANENAANNSSPYASLDAPASEGVEDVAPAWWVWTGGAPAEVSDRRPLPDPPVRRPVRISEAERLAKASRLGQFEPAEDKSFRLDGKLTITGYFGRLLDWSVGDLAGLSALDYAALGGHDQLVRELRALDMRESIPSRELDHPYIVRLVDGLRVRLARLSTRIAK